MAGIGHNGGPELDGRSWRAHCWRHARRDLLPHMPLNVVRRRVGRARELGLDYGTYATIRATTGRDIIGFLFSNNALGLFRDGQPVAGPVSERLAYLPRADRIGLAPQGWHALPPLDRWAVAPAPHAIWREVARAMDHARESRPADGMVLVAAAPWERDWCAAGRLAAHLPAATFFAPR